MNDVVKFPHEIFVLKCPDCYGQDWAIHVDAPDFTKILGFECAECNYYIELEAIPCVEAITK